MAKLTYTIEKSTKTDQGIQHQEIEISCEAKSIEEAKELDYDDFSFNLFINGRHIADISPIIGKLPFYQEICDSIDWVAQFQEHQAVSSF